MTKGADANASFGRGGMRDGIGGMTPLDFAEQIGITEITELLCKHGAE